MGLENESFTRLRQDVLNVITNSVSRAIKTGCIVTPNATQPPIEIDVASGTVYFGVTEVTVTGQSVALDTAHATLDRYDIIVVNSSGVASFIKGTAAADPEPPDIDMSIYVVLARILVTAGTTVLITGDIKDMRIIFEILSSSADKLPLAGGTMAGDINLGTNDLINVGDVDASTGTIDTFDATTATITTLGCGVGTTITEFSIDGTLAGNSDNTVSTEKAVKTAIDAIPLPALELVETKTLSSPSNSITFTGLNLDTAGIYFIQYEVEGSTSSGTLELRLNGVSGSVKSCIVLNGGARSVTTVPRIDGLVWTGYVTSGYAWIKHLFSGRLIAEGKSNQYRTDLSQENSISEFCIQCGTGNLTNFTLYSTITMITGSKCSLYKLKK